MMLTLTIQATLHIGQVDYYNEDNEVELKINVTQDDMLAYVFHKEYGRYMRDTDRIHDETKAFIADFDKEWFAGKYHPEEYVNDEEFVNVMLYRHEDEALEATRDVVKNILWGNEIHIGYTYMLQDGFLYGNDIVPMIVDD